MDNLLHQKLKTIRCVILDVDGVLSDGLLYLANHGDELKAFHVQDGLGLVLLKCAGLNVAVITGSKNAIIDTRMAQLGIQNYYSGQRNKMVAFEKLKSKLKLDNSQCLYIGDDLPDLPIMQQVAVSCTVANGRPELKMMADYITEKNGGAGAVREICDLLLNSQDKLQLALDGYLNHEIE